MESREEKLTVESESTSYATRKQSNIHSHALKWLHFSLALTTSNFNEFSFSIWVFILVWMKFFAESLVRSSNISF